METIRIHITDAMWEIQLGIRDLKVHDGEQCRGRNCCIHNPSDHPMKNAALNYRADRSLMERLCSDCGSGCPDPDDLYFKKEVLGRDINGESIHGCCGACRGQCRLKHEHNRMKKET